MIDLDARRLLIFFAVLACKSVAPHADGGAPSASPAPTRDELEATRLGALCLLSTIPDVPEGEPNDETKKDAVPIVLGGIRGAWIMVSQTSSPIEREKATRYFWLTWTRLLHCCDGAIAASCGSRWDDARTKTILTAVVLTQGTKASGTWLVFGGKVASEHMYAGVEVEGSADDARKRAVELATANVGLSFTPIDPVPAEWSRATR